MKHVRSVDKLKDLLGCTRVRRKFLFLPKTFSDGVLKETRWLCFASVVEQVQPWVTYMDAFPIGVKYQWTEIGFLDSHVWIPRLAR